MSEGTIETMLSRIERLERSNRAMKFIAIGAIVASVALNALPALAIFPHGPARVDAESFNLVSPKGVLVATLAQGANGGYLAFFDAKGNAEMLVGTGSDAKNPSMGVGVFDGNSVLPRSDSNKGIDRMFWGSSTTNSTTTLGEFLLDPAGKSRLSNTTANDGSNAVSVFYDGTHERAGIGLGTTGPGLFFEDSTGAARILESVKPDDSATVMTMLNSAGNPAQPLLDLSALGDGSDTTLQVEDGTGHQRLIQGFSTGSQEIIQLHNGSGTETFRAPCTGAACP